MGPSNTNQSIHTFPDANIFGRRLARALQAPFYPIGCRQFPDGESLVQIQSTPAKKAVLVRSLQDPNAKLVEILLAADALRRAGAGKVVLVAPYLGYMRQDAVFHPGEPISQQVIGAMLASTFDEVLTLDAHLHRIRSLSEVFPNCRARSISSAAAVAKWVSKGRTPPLLVGPDEESAPWVRSVASLAKLDWILGKKERRGDTQVCVELPSTIKVKRAVIIDDIASSGATIAAAARALHKRGVKQINVAVVHAIFASGALGRIERAGVSRIVSCDTIPHPTNAIHTAPLIAEKLSLQIKTTR